MVDLRIRVNTVHPLRQEPIEGSADSADQEHDVKQPAENSEFWETGKQRCVAV